MDAWTIIDLAAAFCLAVAGGAVFLGMALALHAKHVFPGAELFSLNADKRQRLLMTWGRIALVALGSVLEFMLVEHWQFAVCATSSIFLAIWLLFRLRLVDAIWAFLTFAVFQLFWLMSFSRQLLFDYY